MKILIAMDSFKGSLSSVEAGNAAAEGFREALPSADVRVFPMADGGEGTVAALSALGGRLETATVSGPLGSPVQAEYLILPDGTAVIESAAAAGLTLVPEGRRDPRYTTTRGLGEMILHALGRGCRKFLIGIGGSATNDGGAGMLSALGVRFLRADGSAVAEGGAALSDLAAIDLSGMNEAVREARFSVACDVTNPLCGPAGASAVFAPQKGANAEDVPVLDHALAHYADVAGTVLPSADRDFPGSGAAGGLGFAFRTFLNAELKSGAELVMTQTGFPEALADADLVVVGEGRIDGQTVMGKAPFRAAETAGRAGVPVVAVCGSVGTGSERCHPCIDAIFPIVPGPCALDEALDRAAAAENLRRTAGEIGRLLAIFRGNASGS